MQSKKILFLANNFFKDLMQGKFTSATKTLHRIKDETGVKERHRGYITALEGMLLASESRKDNSTVINQIDSKEADKFLRAFSRHSRNRLQRDFDRGFFQAWIDYTQALKNSN